MAPEAFLVACCNLLAPVADGAPVFVGVARHFDVASYLKGFAHTSLVQVQYAIELTTQEKKGAGGPLAAPATLDWWVAKADGAGSQSIAWPIADGPYDVVVMGADGKTAPDVQVDLGSRFRTRFWRRSGVVGRGDLGCYWHLPDLVPAAQRSASPPSPRTSSSQSARTTASTGPAAIPSASAPPPSSTKAASPEPPSTTPYS